MAEYIEREIAMQIAFTSPFFSDALMEEIKAVPAADVAPVVYGRWIEKIIPGEVVRLANLLQKSTSIPKTMPRPPATS